MENHTSQDISSTLKAPTLPEARGDDMPIPIADWLHSLDRMEVTLASTQNALEQHERAWGQILHSSLHADSPETVAPLARFEARLGEWDARLSAVGDLAASVERELSDRQAAIGRWQELFNDWRGSIEQPAKPAAVTS